MAKLRIEHPAAVKVRNAAVEQMMKARVEKSRVMDTMMKMAEETHKEMEAMEQSGATFQNKQRQDVRIRYVAPVAVTVMMLLLMGGIAGLILWLTALSAKEAPPAFMLAIIALVPLVISGGVVLALVQRIREIGKGEIDDAKNY